jgi:hypothetical protein
MSDRQCPSCGGICKKSGCERANLDPMDDPLKRVIAEQQTKIDRLDKQLASAHETLNTIWTKHNDLFESFARMIDVNVPDDISKEYRRLRQTCRVGMLEAGYCMTCYNFVCECEGQYD